MEISIAFCFIVLARLSGEITFTGRRVKDNKYILGIITSDNKSDIKVHPLKDEIKTIVSLN